MTVRPRWVSGLTHWARTGHARHWGIEKAKRQPCPRSARFRVRVVAPPGQRTSSLASLRMKAGGWNNSGAGGDPVKRRARDGELRPARVLTQFREHVPAIANAVDRETGDLVCRLLLVKKDQGGGVGSLIAVGGQHLERANQLRVRIHAHIEQV